MAWQWFTDAACTQVFSGVLNYTHRSDFSDNPQDRVLYYANISGDPADNQALKLVRDDSSNIIVRIEDSAAGSGHEATEVKLATTAAGLDGAIAGASLSLGPQLLSGLTGAQPVHIRVINNVTVAGLSTELTLRANENVEYKNV